ncbi:MAG: NAD(P)/FAD-dependent oxidoreductase [Rubrimonas sp.]
MSDTPAPPRETEVVVIGGGIVGVSAALFLAEWGVPCVVVEKGRVGAEQSGRNWGWIRKQGRDLRELPLMIESARQWARIVPLLDRDVGFRRAGTTYLAETDAQMAEREAWVRAAQPFQLDSRVLSAAETDALLGRDDRRFRGCIHTPSDCTAEPGLASPAVGRLAAATGATVVEGCAARGLVMRAGRVAGVVTERGEIACRAVILAGGAWSRTFLENLGAPLAQLAIRSSALRTGPAPEIHPGGLGAPGASLRRRPDGGYTVARSGAAEFRLIPAAFAHLPAFLPVIRSQWRIMKIRAGADFFGPLGRRRWADDQVTPFERHRVLDPAPDMALLNDVLAAARALHPRLGDIRIEQAWAGMIDVTPDELPVIDHLPQRPGLVLATGLSGHGFGLGPGAGLLAAQLATGRAPAADPAPFAYARLHPRAAAIAA